MVAALLHNGANPARGIRRPRRDRRRQRARPSPARPGVVLPADDGLHPRLAVSGRRAGELEAGARPSRRGAERRCSPTRAFRDAVRAELATPTTFRLFNSEWDKVHVVETARPDLARLEQRSIGDEHGARSLAFHRTSQRPEHEGGGYARETIRRGPDGARASFHDGRGRRRCDRPDDRPARPGLGNEPVPGLHCRRRSARGPARAT